MSKEQGNSAECIKNVARKNKDFFMVQDADGKTKMESLAKGVENIPTPEQMEELKKGNVAYASMHAILHNDNMLMMEGRATQADPERAYNAVMRAESELAAKQTVLQQGGQVR